MHLYEFKDENRRILAPFNFLICRGKELEEINNYLLHDSFKSEELIDTNNLITRLAWRVIGINDQRIINEKISNINNVVLYIELNWKDGKKPPPIVVYLKSKFENNGLVQLIVGG